MNPGDKTKHVISKAVRKRGGRKTQEVVYKTYMGKHKGKAWFTSKTRHEVVA